MLFRRGFLAETTARLAQGFIERGHDELHATRDFVGESSKCNSTFSKAVNVGGLENARRVMGTLAPSTVGPGCDGLWVYCEYTQRRLGLRAAEKLE